MSGLSALGWGVFALALLGIGWLFRKGGQDAARRAEAQQQLDDIDEALEVERDVAADPDPKRRLRRWLRR